MDCCHLISVLDLPFQFVADGQHDQMEPTPVFGFGPFLPLAQQWLVMALQMRLLLKQWPDVVHATPCS
jgi:hypothetical protein